MTGSIFVPLLALLLAGPWSVDLAATERLPLGTVSDLAAGPLPVALAGSYRYAMSRAPIGCMDPAMSDYLDVKRHLTALRTARICYRRQVVREGRFQWVFHSFLHPDEPDGPFWLLPHDDEDTAFEAAVYAVATYGGGFLAIDSGQRRNFLGQDPNRNFSRTYAESALCRKQARPSPKFTAAVLEHFERRGRYPYLALHNNEQGWIGDGGRGTISAYKQSSVLRGFTSSVARGPLRDPDNLVYIAGSRPYELDRHVQERVAGLNRLGLNVVYKQVTARSFDCSLSDYLTRNRLGDYYNLEAQHGQPVAQKGMIDRLMKYLGRRPLHGTPWDGGLFQSGSVPGNVAVR